MCVCVCVCVNVCNFDLEYNLAGEYIVLVAKAANNSKVCLCTYVCMYVNLCHLNLWYSLAGECHVWIAKVAYIHIYIYIHIYYIYIYTHTLTHTYIHTSRSSHTLESLVQGVGIKLFDRLSQVQDARGTGRVLQKYVEQPLLLRNNRKFDIRVWVLVTDWNQLAIWVYDDCLVRVCSEPFDLADISSRTRHLTNVSVNNNNNGKNVVTTDNVTVSGKHVTSNRSSIVADGDGHEGYPISENDSRNRNDNNNNNNIFSRLNANGDANINGQVVKTSHQGGNMFEDNVSSRTEAKSRSNVAKSHDKHTWDDNACVWSSSQLEHYLRECTGDPDIWREKVFPAIRKLVIRTLRCAQNEIKNRKNSFELYGFDIMLDKDMHPWLLEVNLSPDLRYMYVYLLCTYTYVYVWK